MTTTSKTKVPATAAPSSAPPSSPLGAWQARNLHTITCPSGQRLRIRLPGIATLLEHGDLPEDLVDLALLELSEEAGATGALAAELAQATESEDDDKREHVLGRVRDYGRFQRALAVAAIREVDRGDGTFVDVELTIEDTYGGLPEDDLAMVSEIVQRLRVHDAKGVRIGVEPLDRWAAFREAHECPDEDCPGCAKLVERLSAVDVVPV